DPGSPGTVYAGTTTGLFKSTDAGTNWTLLTNGLTFSNISALAIGPLYSTNVYAGTLGVDGFGGDDTFAVKFGAYSVVFGGNQNDEGRDIVVDSSGQAFIVGTTASADFPTSNALGYLGTFNGGLNDGFVTALNADASGYVYSTYLGGAGYDAANAILLDA